MAATSGAGTGPALNSGEDRAAAVDCLAAAITYEAGNESTAGQAAVAQVVLNRVRHPAFPKTVCGVVYQGAARRTGCQFTFTCDGSLLRPRSARSWATARGIALTALDGRLPATIGTATHYHADYVMPRWAPALVEVGSIGRHIFYRFPGPAGQVGAFVAPGTGHTPATPRSTAPGQVPAFRAWGLPVVMIPAGR